MKEQFYEWIKEITHGKIHEYTQLIQGENSPDGWFETLKIYTHNYSYQITAEYYNNIETLKKHSYLGCIMSCRTPRAGEDWLRGRDMPDGPLSQETWDRIKNAIINHELVKVAKKMRSPILNSFEKPKTNDIGEVKNAS